MKLNQIAKTANEKIEYLGNYLTWNSNKVYAIFYTKDINYIIELE